MNPPVSRIASIDITRALTMALMIFVNDLWTLHDIPAWLGHTQAREDGMGLADTVFPAFLFIVGMSIPYAIAGRIRKGDDTLRLLRHVMERTAALLIMGLFLVNGEYLNAEATGISRGGWNILSCLAFIAIWNQYPARLPSYVPYLAKMAGALLLAFLFYICRSGDNLSFSIYWWGILGLIGWAYLAAALTFVWGKGKLAASIIVWLIMIGVNIAAHAQALPEIAWLRAITGPLGEGGHAALVLGGVIVSTIFRQYAPQGQAGRVAAILGGLTVVWLAAGFAVRPIGGISKILATPSWVLICSAITTALFIFVYWLCDLRGKASWFNIIKPAGTDTLLCYLMPYFAYAILTYAGIAALGHLGGAVGLLKSLVFAVVMIQLAGLVNKAGIRLKL
ncbi:heparan-alpha-glucosaminide N-acetyltransferase domain-containing protein [Chitinophaga lutea]